MNAAAAAGPAARLVRAAGAAVAVALASSLATAPSSAAAEARAGSPRIGVLLFVAAPTDPASDPTEAAVRRGLREAGYVEGENLVVERRYAAGRPERLQAMADELVRLKVDVLVTGGQPPREAARRATQSIPIVTLSGSDPVREGWARTLAQPGGNVTGLTFSFPALSAKRLELLKEAAPSATRVAVLIDPVELVDAKEVEGEVEAAARRLGLQIQLLEVAGAKDLDAAFAAARRQQAQALLSIAMWPHRDRIAALASANQLPAMGEAQDAEAGYLLAYGVDLDDLIRRSMLLVGKILKGARAGELPIERPTQFRLSVNLKTAKALGVTLPQSLLLRADEVIR